MKDWIIIALIIIGAFFGVYFFIKALKTKNDSDSVGYIVFSGILCGISILGLIGIIGGNL